MRYLTPTTHPPTPSHPIPNTLKNLLMFHFEKEWIHRTSVVQHITWSTFGSTGICTSGT